LFFLEVRMRLGQRNENRKNREAIIAYLQKQIEALTAGLQRVSAQLEVSKAALLRVGSSKKTFT
jgi:hypothetical protein